MPTLIIDGDAAGTVSAHEKAIKAQRDLADGMVKTNGIADKQERAMKRIFEESKAPAEKYAKQVETINAYCDKHAIAEGRRADMLGLVTRKYQAAGAAGEQSFGAAALGNITSYAAGLVSIGAALGVIKAGMAAYAAEREKALGSSNDYTKSFAKLSEYGDHGLVSQGQFKGARLDAIAEKLYTDTGLERQAVGELVAKAEASGVVDELHKPQMKQLMATGLVDAGTLDAIQQIRMSMGRGADGKLSASFQDVLQTSFAAATVAPGQTKDVLRAMSPSMLLAHKAGYSLEQMAAFNSVVMKTLGIDEGGTAATNVINKMPATLRAYHLKTTGDPLHDLQAILGKRGGVDAFMNKGDKEETNIRTKKGLISSTENAPEYEALLQKEREHRDFAGEIVGTQLENPIMAHELVRRRTAAQLDAKLLQDRKDAALVEALGSGRKATTGAGVGGFLERARTDFWNKYNTDESVLAAYLSNAAEGGGLAPDFKTHTQLEADTLRAYGQNPDAMNNFRLRPRDRARIAEHYGLDKTLSPGALQEYEQVGAPYGADGQPHVNPEVMRAFIAAAAKLEAAVRENTAATKGNTQAAPAARPRVLSPTNHRE